MIDGGDELAKWKDFVTGVGKGDAGSSNHAALTHGEAGNDGKAEDGEGDFLW